jgi:hypothetical protein
MYLDLVKLLRSTLSVNSFLPSKWGWDKYGSGEGVGAELLPGMRGTEFGGSVDVDYLMDGRVGISITEGDTPGR